MLISFIHSRGFIDVNIIQYNTTSFNPHPHLHPHPHDTFFVMFMDVCGGAGEVTVPDSSVSGNKSYRTHLRSRGIKAPSANPRFGFLGMRTYIRTYPRSRAGDIPLSMPAVGIGRKLPGENQIERKPPEGAQGNYGRIEGGRRCWRRRRHTYMCLSFQILYPCHWHLATSSPVPGTVWHAMVPHSQRILFFW